MSRWICFTLCLGVASPAFAETFTLASGDDLIARLQSLSAGDEVIVSDGTWDTGGFLEVTWTGTEAAPIIIRAADGARPHIRGVRSQNVINVVGSHFTIRGFEISGGSHGIRLGSADHATFEDLTLHDLGDVGISCNRSDNVCDAINVIRNEIYDTGVDGGPGEGMYIGCNDAACVVSNSVFAENYIHDIGGSQGDGIEIKTGSFGNVVRDNVIIGANFPGITMYGFAGGGERNIVEGNFIWGTVDNGIQIVGQVIVRNNIILDAGANGIQSKPSQGFEPHDLLIVHNTIFNAGNACLKSNGWGGQSGQIVANNAVYCQGGIAVDINGGAPMATFSANIALGDIRAPSGFTAAGGVGDLDMPADDPPVMYPPVGSPLIDAGDSTYGTAVDFDGSPRSDGSPDVGAYERSGDNPLWSLARDFKGSTAAPGLDAGPGRDAGPSADAGARADGGTSSGDGGCGCTTSAPVSNAVGLLLAMVWVIRRR